MGLSVDADGRRLTMATRYQIRELVDALPEDETYEGYDRVYVPRRAYTTGELDAHDIARTETGEILFVNTRFSCLAQTSETCSFRVVWTPSFLSQISPEDRCHLNGLAMHDGCPRYVTAASSSDVASGWRDRRKGGGVVIDVDTGEVVARGLTMPHSPRIHEGELYLLNAGTGDLGRIDRTGGSFEPLAFYPGFGRGLAFWKHYAIIGTSKPRGDEVFRDLPLGTRLRDKDAEPRCGVFVVDLNTGATAHWMTFTDVVDELYDVQVLPRTIRPMALGFKTDEIRRFITIENDRSTSGSPQRFLLALSTPEATDSEQSPMSRSVSGNGSTPSGPTDPLPSLELPKPARHQMRSRRASRDESIQVRVGTSTVGELLSKFESFVPRSMSQQIQSGQISANQTAWASLAVQNQQALGLAVALPVAGGREAEVRVLAVVPAYRGQGLGTVMIQRIEAVVTQTGRSRLRARFRSDHSGQAALERIAEKCSWEPPQVESYVFKIEVGDVASRESPMRTRRPPEVSAWEDLTVRQLQSIAERVRSGAIPKGCSPLHMNGQLLENAGVALCGSGNVFGWAVPRRLSNDVAQMRALYLDEDAGSLGDRIDLLVHALCRQHEQTDVRTTVLTVGPSEKDWVGRLEKRLGAVLAGPTTVYVTETELHR
jgi:uncharacterized protein (TIGR03032 family)